MTILGRKKALKGLHQTRLNCYGWATQGEANAVNSYLEGEHDCFMTGILNMVLRRLGN